MKYLPYIQEKLRGAAQDCNVNLQPDQVRYIIKAVIQAYERAVLLEACEMANKNEGDEKGKER